METASQTHRLTSFEFEGKVLPVIYRETTKFNDYPGVECDVYDFVGNNGMDLAIIKIAKGCKTPDQEILKGKRTIEGFVLGKGRLVLKRKDGPDGVYPVSDRSKFPFSIDVKIGDKMQWIADTDSELVAYEICIPKYQEGRYRNLPEKVEASE